MVPPRLAWGLLPWVLCTPLRFVPSPSNTHLVFFFLLDFIPGGDACCPSLTPPHGKGSALSVTFPRSICWLCQYPSHPLLQLHHPPSPTPLCTPQVMKNIVPVIMAGILGIYGLIVAAILVGKSASFVVSPASYSPLLFFHSTTHPPARLLLYLTSLFIPHTHKHATHRALPGAQLTSPWAG